MFRKIRSRQGRGQEDKDEDTTTAQQEEVGRNPFDGVDIVFSEDELMEVYEKGKAPPETANFPDVFGGSPQKQKAAVDTTAEGETADTTTQKTEEAIPEEVKELKIPDIDPPEEKTPPTDPPPPPPTSPPPPPPPPPPTTTTTTTTSTNEGTDASVSQDHTNTTAVPPMMMMSSTIRETVESGVSKRNDFPLIAEKTLLLIIDIQKYLSHADDAQSYYHGSLQTMIQNVPKLISAFRTRRDTNNQGCEVIFTFLQAMTNDGRDISLDYKLSGPKLANIPKIGTPHDQLFLESVMPDIHLGRGDILLPKTSCSVFASTNIDYLLRNLHAEQLVLCGQLTDQCVESAVRDAADLGYLVTVVNDACAAQSAEAETKGFHGMKGFCRNLTTQQVLEELDAQLKVAALSVAKNAGIQLRSSNQMVDSSVTATAVAKPRSFASSEEAAYASALLHSLKAAGVEFLRYLVVDACNTVRVKAAPVDQLLRKSCLNYQIALATVVVAGLPTYGDAVTPGTGLDASGVMIIQPDVTTLRILPYAPKSAVVLGSIHDPLKGGTMSDVCTRGMLQRVAKTAIESLGIELCVGAEIEFCLHELNGKPVDSSIFCNSTTLNQQEDFISELYNQLKQQRIPVEAIHAESAPGQLEVVIAYQTDPVTLADFVLLAQETILAVSRKHSMKALFLPKVHAMQAGNGLHVHLSFNDLTTSQNAFSSGVASGLSSRGESFLEGILQHLPSLLALTMPTTNSFRRMGPGCWTGSGAEWDVEDKESALRVCSNLYSQEWIHVEYKLNDSSANLYLSLAGILSCGLDGIFNSVKLRPRRSDQNSHDVAPALPGSLADALVCLEQDELLMQMMGTTLSQSYLALRRAEANRALDMTLENEVGEALQRA